MITIKDAWERAEEICFSALVKATGSKRDYDCFLGYLPKDRPAWMFSSGGIALEPIGRFWGSNPSWCSLPFNAEIVTQFEDRSECLQFSGKVIAMLKDTTNMQNKGNVMWLRLADLPSQPQPVNLSDEVIIWTNTIPLQMVCTTSEEYS